jgi:hypothetical protein
MKIKLIDLFDDRLRLVTETRGLASIRALPSFPYLLAPLFLLDPIEILPTCRVSLC